MNPDSDLFRAHPTGLAEPGRESLTSRHELLLDLREGRGAGLYRVLGLRRTGRGGREICEMGHEPSVLPLGTAAHEYILGLYDVLRRIFALRPDILLETCLRRQTASTWACCAFRPQIWCSDDTDPIERLDIQGGLLISLSPVLHGRPRIRLAPCPDPAPHAAVHPGQRVVFRRAGIRA